MKYPIPFPATIKCRAANIIPISINAIPYNTFIHCIFNFIQALLSYRGFGTLPNKQFCRAKYGSGYPLPMLAMKVLSLVIYYNGKPLFAKRE